MIKSIKKISIGLGAFVALFATLLAPAFVGSSTGVSAQTPPAVAKTAQLLLSFTDGTTADAAQTVFTVSVASGNCVAPLAGTLHSPFSGSNTGLGPVNSSVANGFHIVTHNNIGTQTTPTGVNSADLCTYSITVTSALNCAFTVRTTVLAAGDESVLLGTATRPTSGGAPSSATFMIRGSGSTSTDIDTFFTPARALALISLNPIPAKGALLTNAGTEITDRGGIVGITLTSTACTAPTIGTEGFSITNAEPTGGINLAVQLNTLADCNPGNGQVGLINIVAGSPQTRRRISFNANCRYTIDVQTGTGTAIEVDPATQRVNAVKQQCDVGAVIFTIETAASTTFGTAAESLDSGTNFKRQDITFGSNNFAALRNPEISTRGHLMARMVLFTTSICPQFGVAQFSFTAASGVADPVAKSPLTVTIVAAAKSAGCIASPSSIVLAGASKVTSVNVVTRLKRGRSCNYTITYPKASGALSLQLEPSGTAGDLTATPPVAGNPAPDGMLDGVIQRNALQLVGIVTTFTYETRKLAIKVSMIFEDDLVFTTSDEVSYRITVTGACARFSPIIARALGKTGTSRTVQAYSGSTIVFDKTLESVESANNQEGPLLYTVPPVVIVKGAAVPCAVEVEETGTPKGCTVVGGRTKTLTFSAGLAAFDFKFDHECPGSTFRSRGFTA